MVLGQCFSVLDFKTFGNLKIDFSNKLNKCFLTNFNTLVLILNFCENFDPL